MSAGFEIHGKSMGAWMRSIATEPTVKETLDWAFTAENQERAEKLANLIKLELQLEHSAWPNIFHTQNTYKRVTLVTILSFIYAK